MNALSPDVPSSQLPRTALARIGLDRSTLGWSIFLAGTVATVILWLGPFAGHVRWVNGDQLSYQRIIDRMREGQDYYRAATAVIHDHQTVRFIRTPVMFWIWAHTGLYSWVVTLLVLVVSSALVGLLSWPVAGLGTELWLVALNHPIGSEQWGYNEVWSLPFVLLAMVAARRERWWPAAGAVLVAALIRETAVLFLIGGSIGALVLKKPTMPWIGACLGWTAFMIWHLSQILPLLEPSATGPAGAGSLMHAIDMFGAWLFPLSALIVVYALWRSRRTFDWFFATPALVLIPFAGLWIYRPYWSYLVLPVAVALWGSPIRRAQRAYDTRGIRGSSDTP